MKYCSGVGCSDGDGCCEGFGDVNSLSDGYGYCDVDCSGSW